MQLRVSSSTISLVTPNPDAAFSQLAITKSIRFSSTIAGRSSRMALRPGLPTISPIKSIFMAILSREIGDPGLPDDGDFDLAGIGQLRLDLLDDILAEHHRIVIGDLLILHHDP